MRTWCEIGKLVGLAQTRPAAVRAVAGAHEPILGTLPQWAQGRLLGGVEAALEGSGLMVVHRTEPRWVPSMLDNGFQWTRWRDADGFEPYEHVLRSARALASGERSEDVLFASLEIVPPSSSMDDVLARGAGEPSRMYGPVVLALDESTLARATAISSDGAQHAFGARAGAIEDLPGIVSERIARVYDHVAPVRGGTSRADDLLERLASADHRARVADLVHDPDTWAMGISGRHPVELHIRGVTPADVRRIHVDPPQLWQGGRSSYEMDRLRPEAQWVAAGVLPPHHVDALLDARTRHAMPVTGTAAHVDARIAVERFNRSMDQGDDAARASIWEYLDKPGPTAQGTAVRIRQMLAGST